MVHSDAIDPDDGVSAMRISVSDAKAQLTDLVRRAEAGDDVVLTRHGQPAVRLTPVRSVGDAEARRRLMETLTIEVYIHGARHHEIRPPVLDVRAPSTHHELRERDRLSPTPHSALARHENDRGNCRKKNLHSANAWHAHLW